MPVGLSQLIRLAWMEETVALIRAGNDRAAAERVLNESLAGTLAVGSNTRRNSRAKTIIALLKVWLDGPEEVFALREAGFDLLDALPPDDRIAVHWGMTQAVYPFWGAVAAHVGRTLRLQGSTSAAQVQRRMRESHGDRKTVYNATNRVLRSFVDWGVLASAEARGAYAPGCGVEVGNSPLAAWLVEALLTSGVGRGSAAQLLHHPSLFPFRFGTLDARDLAAQSPRLELLRHGYDDDLIMLVTERSTV